MLFLDRRWRLVDLSFLLLFSCCSAVLSQEMEVLEEEPPSEITLMNIVDWQLGPTTGEMGDESQIEILDGYMFVGAEGTRTLMQLFGNLLTDREVGMIAPVPVDGDGNMPWFVVFEFNPIGYVKDDEKDQLDAEVMLNAMKEGETVANEERIKQGYGALHTIGWAVPPRYNETTQNLEWAIKLRSETEGQVIVNHNTRILGREGVMSATLVIDPEVLEATLPTFQQCLTGFSYKPGKRYAQFQKGDKIAKYGLTGLVMGGGVALAAKAGLFKKVWKFIVIGVVAAGAWAKRLFGRGKTVET